MATLELTGLRKSFGSTEILREIDLSLDSGEMLVIVGESGCGKSTLLRMIAGLETPSAGKVVLEGRDITHADPSARDIAMVFQNYALYPHMTVFDNMAYGLRVRGVPKADIQHRVDAAASLLGLSQLMSRKPRQLSGGQRQRVAMGRAIVREPKLFLFDEPLSNLDATLRVRTRAEIRRLQRRLGITSLFVTHDQVEAMTLGDRLLVLHQGRPAQLATPMEVFDHPADTYVAGFIGAPAMNFLPAVLANAGSAAQLHAGPLIRFVNEVRGRPDGTTLTIGIRPEHIRVGSDGLPLTVDLIEPLGSETLVHGRLAAPGETSIVVRLAGRAPDGESLRLEFPSDEIHVFDGETGRRLN